MKSAEAEQKATIQNAAGSSGVLDRLVFGAWSKIEKNIEARCKPASPQSGTSI